MDKQTNTKQAAELRQSDSSKLLGCPVCGEEPNLGKLWDGPDQKYYYQIVCENEECLNLKTGWRSLSDAKKLWNHWVAHKNIRKTILGGYIGVPEDGDLIAFSCSECGHAQSIVNDPKKEQPNYCFNCGVRYNWEEVYEKLMKESETA